MEGIEFPTTLMEALQPQYLPFWLGILESLVLEFIPAYANQTPGFKRGVALVVGVLLGVLGAAVTTTVSPEVIESSNVYYVYFVMALVGAGIPQLAHAGFKALKLTKTT